ncbi:MAG: hypothetical protein P8X43_05125 [Maritimibacter sp.]
MDDQIFVLLGLLILAVPVLLIVFMIWVVKLSGRVRELETRLEKMSGRLDAPVLAAAPKAPEAAPDIAAEAAPTAEPQPSAPPEPKADRNRPLECRRHENSAAGARRTASARRNAHPRCADCLG